MLPAMPGRRKHSLAATTEKIAVEEMASILIQSSLQSADVRDLELFLTIRQMATLPPDFRHLARLSHQTPLPVNKRSPDGQTDVACVYSHIPAIEPLVVSSVETRNADRKTTGPSTRTCRTGNSWKTNCLLKQTLVISSTSHEHDSDIPRVDCVLMGFFLEEHYLSNVVNGAATREEKSRRISTVICRTWNYLVRDFPFRVAGPLKTHIDYQ